MGVPSRRVAAVTNSFADAATALLATVTNGSGDAPVTLGPPTESESLAVSVHVQGVRLGYLASHRDHRQLPVKLLAIVTVSGPPDAAVALLHDIIHAALSDAQIELTGEEVPIAVWNAFGIRPQLSIGVAVPTHVDVTFPKVPLVSQPLVLDQQLADGIVAQ